MHRFCFVVFFAVLAATSATAQPQTPTHQVKLNGHTFTLPEGFTIELVAGADLAPRPIVAALDEKGRLYVCDSSGSNDKVAEQLKNKPHRIVRLESTKNDGKFDKQTVFVKNVMFPEGAMWLNDSLFVAAPPHILKFTDTNDDGVADKEEIWFDGKTLTGCANDLHGPYRGPDGYVYWCKGAFAHQEHVVNNKKFSTRAAHIFRTTPDGKNIEPVMTGGMDNPVDVVFTPGGDLIFNTTFFQHPGGGKRDGLVHAIYGGVYGKDHDVVYEHPWTSPQLMPVLTHMGPAAPCGLHRYESDQFGNDYANNIFCCQFNLRKVSRHVLVPKGSTYETRDSNFVVSDSIDFHPTDVIEDADGSLLVVDTGGWYKLCCPTSQLVKPDVTGAIYRVKKVGAHAVEDPRGLAIDLAKADTETLEKLFRDPRPVVRQRVTDFLVTRLDATSSKGIFARTCAPGNSEETRVNAVWAMSRCRELDFALLARMVSKDGPISTAAANVLGLHRHKPAVDTLCQFVKEGSPPVRRACATALGRIGDPAAISAIRTALSEPTNDRALDHALTYALIEIADAKATTKLLTNSNPAVRRAALAALEHIPSSNLEAKAVLAELDSPNAALRETAWWIAGRHPQWGGQLAGYFKDKLKAADQLAPTERDELTTRLIKFASNPTIQKVLGESLTGTKLESARVALNVMARSGSKIFPAVWRDALLAGAKHFDNDAVLRDALTALRVLPTEAKDYDTFVAQLPRVKLWPSGVVPTEFRLALLAARPAGQELDAVATNYLLHQIARDEPATDRAAAADVLLRAKLTTEQLGAVAEALNTTSPLDLAKLLNVFTKTTDERVGLVLVKALRDKAVRPALRTELVKPVLDKYPQAVKDEAEKLYAELADARKGETARLEKLLSGLKPGDVRRGQLVFNSAKTNCVACHKVGYVGGTVGPDLTKIGSIRTERDLLESVVFPSASFVRSYEPVRVVTTDDRTLNGVLKKDAPDEIVIVVAADKEERIARADIGSIAPSIVSLMPAGMEQLLTPQELADLIAFLKACR
ncbi:heme-binding protein : Putative membrane-bound dehydrogenase OS=Singulisphaera acidiphila (strain ATCC BAA-1392 / DSM 18658 / VKM B-2454 / MOB10) GN=Sinac_7042 PE=4 SV=1: HEAT_2: Cytochrom_C [Gemmata massiliana]|uniref:Cytochrome c domain-containing protein n=1 Tax=Gemmata massiliana TaxID=1210884 RepID=A0A6P2DLN6_9BACT|nr:PVC-type heme-binding CxxCH protein [Gemmata massiliana]VTS03779.1 heme-binding protein : Putative membrane-bound dehydrogenase OS=Singulisphaera acidiphila (strain ATCC BAA-1392 / DSM 18658 / VKM B-2454 / MOB10) GN=Sinac_7042 PE=4 SV=1: HEAT_2: Cytochrom_C [Gemmata massiliana]